MTLAASETHALPLQVRARSQVNLSLDRSSGQPALVGTLVDDSGDPIGRKSVSVTIDGVLSESVLSAADGTFRLPLSEQVLEQATGKHGASVPWSVVFDGGRQFGKSKRTGVVDAVRRPTSLDLKVAPTRMQLFSGQAYVSISLQSGATPLAGRAVGVRVGDGAELFGTTDTYGSATFFFPVGMLRAAGRYTVEARFLGDSLHSPALATTHLTVTQPTRVTLRVGREGSEREGRYRFSGRLSGLGGPVVGATVAVLVQTSDGSEEQVLRLVQTDERGVFLAAVSGQELLGQHRGDLMMRAVYSPTDDVTSGAISRPVSVGGGSGGGVPSSYYLIALAWLAALAGLVYLVRRRVFARWWAALRSRKASVSRPPPERASERAIPFITPTRAPRGPTGRNDAVSGVVVDGHARDPLDGVTITLTSDTDRHTTRTNSAGHFEVAGIEPGRWVLTMTLAGYSERSTELPVPHAGQLDGAQFALVAIRRAVRDIYSEALASFDGTLEWGHTTPREAFDLAQIPTNDRGRALGELRHVVERAWYGGDSPEGADELRARQLAARVQSEGPR